MNTNAWITAILAVGLAASVVWNSMLESDVRMANDRIRAQDATIQRLSNEMLAMETKGMTEVRHRLEKIEGLKTKIAEKKRELAGLDQAVAQKNSTAVDRGERLRIQSEVERQRDIVHDLNRQLIAYQDQQKAAAAQAQLKDQQKLVWKQREMEVTQKIQLAEASLQQKLMQQQQLRTQSFDPASTQKLQELDTVIVEEQRALAALQEQKRAVPQAQEPAPAAGAERVQAELRQGIDRLIQQKDAETKRLGELEQRLAKLTLIETNDRRAIASADANRAKLDREILDLERELSQQQENASAAIAE